VTALATAVNTVTSSPAEARRRWRGRRWRRGWGWGPRIYFGWGGWYPRRRYWGGPYWGRRYWGRRYW
jgi:hypothetical protein